MRDRVLKAVTFHGIEFLFLLGLWTLFVSQVKPAELAAGACAAALGAAADGLVKAKRLAKFRPRPLWLALFSWEPWYVLAGSARVFRALIRQLTNKRPQAQFRVVSFRAGGSDSKSEARRAIAIAAISFSPDTIAVGIDHERGFMLLHQIAPSPVPKIARRLGAQS